MWVALFFKYTFLKEKIFGEVFVSLNDETQEFLLKTSIVDEMCSSLCNYILDIDNSQYILEELDNLNLFMIPLDENKEWYRYHHLFKDFLRRRLERTMKNILHEIQFNAGEWYKENQLLSEAVAFYLKAQK